MFPPVAPGGIVAAFGELIQDQLCVTERELASEGQIDGIMSFHRGGCAPNVLATAAALGVPARMLGHFGADAVSSGLADQLQRAGVRVFGVRRGRGASSLCIQLPSGRTMLVFDPADSRSVRPIDVRSWWFKDTSVLHLNSHHLYADEMAPTFWRVVELAQDAQIPISLDTSAVNALRDYGVDRYRDALRSIRPAVLMTNGPEGDTLGLAEEYPEGVAVVVHHRGPDPTRVYMTTGDYWEVAVPHCDNVVDTVGAGDVFAGGFLVGWVQGRSLRGCVEIAHDVAVKSVQQYGVEVPRERPAGLSEVG